MARRDAAGDLVQFLVGGCLFGAGGFLLANQVTVRSELVWGRFGRWGGGFQAMPWGTPGMGLLMLPLGIGVCLLFAGTSRRWANLLIWASLAALLVGVLNSLRMTFMPVTLRRWANLLIWASLAALLVGVLNSLRMTFMPVTLWQLGVYVVMIAAGGGLMFRGLRAYDDQGRAGIGHSDPTAEGLRREIEELRARIDAQTSKD